MRLVKEAEQSVELSREVDNADYRVEEILSLDASDSDVVAAGPRSGRESEEECRTIDPTSTLTLDDDWIWGCRTSQRPRVGRGWCRR